MCVGVNAGKVFRAGFNGNKTQEQKQKSAEGGTEDEFHRINISQVFVYSEVMLMVYLFRLLMT